MRQSYSIATSIENPGESNSQVTANWLTNLEKTEDTTKKPNFLQSTEKLHNFDNKLLYNQYSRDLKIGQMYDALKFEKEKALADNSQQEKKEKRMEDRSPSMIF